MTTAMVDTMWQTCAALFIQWRAAVERVVWDLDDGAAEPPPTYTLTGRCPTGACYWLEYEAGHGPGAAAPHLVRVHRHFASGPRAQDWHWEAGPGRPARAVPGVGWPAPSQVPGPGGPVDALTGFVPWPREDELFAYRPAGGDDVAALLMWRWNDLLRQPYARPGVRWAGPVPPRFGAILTLPGRAGWPEALQGGDLDDVWRLVDTGQIVPLTAVAAVSDTPPLWLTARDGRDEGVGVQWVGPVGPGLPEAGVYSSGILGDRAKVDPEECDAEPLGDYHACLLADQAAVDAAVEALLAVGAPLPQN